MSRSGNERMLAENPIDPTDPTDPEEMVQGLLDTQSPERRDRGLRALLAGYDPYAGPGGAKGASATAAEVTPSLLADLALGPWAGSLAATRGGARCLCDRVAAPITDTAALRAWAEHARALVPDHDALRPLLATMAAHEDALHWAFDLPPTLKEAWPAGMLYPEWPILRRMNTVPALIGAYHAYKGYLAPLLSLLHPLSALLAPWFYIRRTLKWRVGLMAYARFLFLAFRAALAPVPHSAVGGGAGASANTVRLGSVIMYVGLFIYGIFQSFQIASILRRVSHGLVRHARSVRAFVAAAHTLVTRVFGGLGAPPTIPDGPAGAYLLWRDETIRAQVRALAQEAYRADALLATTSLLRQGWVVPEWLTAGAETRLYGLRHPLLPASQVANPLSLARSLVITGPNAAGKTTYMKAVAAAHVCAQSLGVVYALRAQMVPAHALGSFVRVSDEVGTASLFEAEALRCARLIASAEAASQQGRHALYLLDEPMHSTPPTEGAAMAYAVLRYLGRLPGVRVLATTHYQALTALAEENPDHFTNISVTAIATAAARGAFRFPYRVRAGSSDQCIAIQLLGDKGLPEEVLRTALKFQGTLCGR